MGTVIADVLAGVAVDEANNTNLDSTSTDNTVTFDFDEGQPNDSSSSSVIIIVFVDDVDHRGAGEYRCR